MKISQLKQYCNDYLKSVTFVGRDERRYQLLTDYIDKADQGSNVSYNAFINSLNEVDKGLFTDNFFRSGRKIITYVFRKFWCDSDNDYTWEAGDYEAETSVYYPGNLESVPDQAVLYSTNGYFFEKTQTKYFTPFSMPLLYQNDVGVTNKGAFSDNGDDAHTAESFSRKSIHPLARLFTKSKHDRRQINIDMDESHEPTLADPLKHDYKWWQMSLAQEEDIVACTKRFFSASCKFSDNKSKAMLAVGASRGAATIFTTIAHGFRELKCNDTIIAGAVLEAPYYEVKGDVESTVYFNRPIMKLVSHHDTRGITPGNSVEKFPDELPILFISSISDEKVPYRSTKKLAYALYEKRKNNANASPVYLLTLNHSSHTGYVFEHPEDREKYLGAVHTFRKKCGLSYIKNFLNEDILNRSKLSTNPSFKHRP